MSSQPVPRIRFGPFELDPRAGELRKQGVRLRLTGQPLEILRMLLASPGEVVTREEVRQRLWPGNTFVDFDHSLNAAVNKLREALGDSAEAPRYVETLPRRGYRFIAPVESPMESPSAPAGAAAASAAPSPSATAPTEPVRKPAATRPNRRPLLIAGAAAAAALLLLVMLAAEARRRSSAGGIATGIRTLAVLPFENMSRDPEQEYFAEGITEALISRLSGIGALHVTSRTSVMQYRNARKPLPEIGRELKVEGIVEGAVQRSGDRVRITAKLIHAKSDRNLWAGTYEDDLRDVLQLQSKVASAIAEEIRVRVTPQERRRLGWSRPIDPEAYAHYLMGRYLRAQSDSPKSAAAFRAALEREPDHAPSWAGLAEAELYGYPPRETMPRARDAALRAVQLDPNMAEAHSVLALVKTFWDWDWKGAEASFRRALELDPRSAENLHRYSHLLAATGRLEEAVARSRRAFELDPLSPNVAHYLGRLYYFQRNLDGALAQLTRAVELDPKDFWARFFLAVALESAGRYDEALDQRYRAAILNGASPDVLGKWRDEYGRLGYAAFRRKTADWEAARTSMPLGSASLALTYARLGEKETALDWLEKAFQSHTRDLIYLKVEPSYDSLRREPRFDALVRRMGFPDFR